MILLESFEELLLGEKESDLVNWAVTFISAFSPTSIPNASTYARLVKLCEA